MTEDQREQKRLAKLREVQSDLSWALAVHMVWKCLDTGDPSQCSLFTDGASPDHYASLSFEDKEAWRNAVAGDIDTPLHVTLLAYIEALEKDPPTGPGPLRKLTEGETAILVNKCGSEYGLRLDALYAALQDYNGPLPPLGTLQDGILTPAKKSPPRKERLKALEQMMTGTDLQVPMVVGYGDKWMTEDVLLRRLREEAGTPEQVVDCLIRFGLVKRTYK